MGLWHENYGELEPLGTVHGQQAHSVRLVENSLALACLQLITTTPNIGHELVQRVAGQLSGEIDELADVGQGLIAPGKRSPCSLKPLSGRGLAPAATSGDMNGTPPRNSESTSAAALAELPSLLIELGPAGS